MKMRSSTRRSKRVAAVADEDAFEVELVRLEKELERERSRARPSDVKMAELARQRSDLLLAELSKIK